MQEMFVTVVLEGNVKRSVGSYPEQARAVLQADDIATHGGSAFVLHGMREVYRAGGVTPFEFEGGKYAIVRQLDFRYAVRPTEDGFDLGLFEVMADGSTTNIANFPSRIEAVKLRRLADAFAASLPKG